jgi:hypothetical protein
MENIFEQRTATRSNTCSTSTGLFELRDTRFGGLKKRYAANRFKLLRTVDPFGVLNVEFKSPLHLDNWLLRIFTPCVISCDAAFQGLKFIEAGKSRIVKADLLTTVKDEIQIVDLVVKGSPNQPPDVWYQLEQVATAFGVVPKLRLEDEIRSNPILLQNLDRWCQHRLCHTVVDRDFQEQVLNAVPITGEITVAELLKELKAFWFARVTHEHLESALIDLYRNGDLLVNVSDLSYCPESTVRSA